MEKNKHNLIGALCQWKTNYYGYYLLTDTSPYKQMDIDGKPYGPVYYMPNSNFNGQWTCDKKPVRLNYPSNVIVEVAMDPNNHKFSKKKWLVKNDLNETHDYNWQLQKEDYIERTKYILIPLESTTITAKLKNNPNVILAKTTFLKIHMLNPLTNAFFPNRFWVKEEWIELSTDKSYSEEYRLKTLKKFKSSH